MSKVIIESEGERMEMSVEEYVEETRRDAGTAILARNQGFIAEGVLSEKVRHNEKVVNRAMEEEGVRFARIRVPFWFRQQDEEVAETFEQDDEIYALVEDYSEKAWRIIASENSAPGDIIFNYEWTFIPKSLATVTWVDVRNIGEAEKIGREAHEVSRRIREEEEEAFENADGWEEKLEEVENR